MTVATGTATRAELTTLADECQKLQQMLVQPKQGDALYGRFTAAQIDTQIAAVTAAITAVNA